MSVKGKFVVFLNSKNRFVIIDIKDILGPKNEKNFY